jgi:hypothetical protein
MNDWLWHRHFHLFAHDSRCLFCHLIPGTTGYLVEPVRIGGWPWLPRMPMC